MDDVISLLIDKLRAYKPEKVIIFGSQVNGMSRPDSDIDLAIIKKTDQPFFRRSGEVRKILRSKIPLDVFVFTPDEYNQAVRTNLLVSEIESTGRVVYEAAN